MKEKINKSLYTIFKDESSNTFLYSRRLSRVFQIDKETFDYLENDGDKIKNKETLRVLNLINQNDSNDTKNRNLHINLHTTTTKDLNIALKEVLSLYNNYNKTVLKINYNYNTSLESLYEWLIGYERVFVILFVNIQDLKSINALKQLLKNNRKIKIFPELYTSVIPEKNLINKNINTRFIQRNTKSYSKLKENLEDSRQIFNLDLAIESEKKIRLEDIITINKSEKISSINNINSICNNCWARNLCHSNYLYDFFSNHPDACNKDDENCSTIKKLIINKFAFKIKSINLDLDNHTFIKNIKNKLFNIKLLNS